LYSNDVLCDLDKLTNDIVNKLLCISLAGLLVGNVSAAKVSLEKFCRTVFKNLLPTVRRGRLRFPWLKETTSRYTEDMGSALRDLSALILSGKATTQRLQTM
jgi:hypothetical protein